MRTKFTKTTLGLLALAVTLGCGPGVHQDPTLLGTGGQGPSPPHEVQVLTPLDMAPYDPQPGKTFRPCGTLGEGQSLSSAYSLDGTLFAMGFSSGVVKIYRTSDLALVATFAKALTAITAVQFSPDGTLLASASTDDPAIEVWRVSDGTTVSRMPGAAFQRDLTFSASGQYLGMTRTEFLAYPKNAPHSTVSIRTVVDGAELCQINDAVLLGLSADGSLAWIAANESVTAYAVQTCSVAGAANVGGGRLFGMSPDGQVVFKYYDAASGQTPNYVGLPLVVAAIRVADGQTVWTVPATGSWPSIDIRLSPKRDYVLLSNIDGKNNGETVLLNANDGTMAAHLELGPLQRFTAVSPDGTTVVTQDSGNEAVFWRAADGANRGQLPKSPLAVPVDAVAFTGDSKQVLVASGGQVRFWAVQDRRATRILNYSYGNSAYDGIAVSHDGRWLATWSGPSMTIRSLAMGDDQALPSDGYWIGEGTTGAFFSADGQYLYYFSDTNAYPAIRIRTDMIGQGSSSSQVSAAFQSATSQLAVSNGGLVAGVTGIGAQGCAVTLAQFDGARVGTVNFAPGDYMIESLALSPDGQYLAAGIWFHSENKYMVRVWRVSDNAVVSSFATPYLPRRLAFSADGTMLVTGQDVWNWRESALVESFLNTYEWNPVISPDGRTIATISGTSTVTLWCRP